MKIKYLLIMAFVFMPSVVLAMPNATISTNVSTIENGKSVNATVTLTDTAAWNIRISGSGAATCSSKQADVTSDGKSTTKSFSLTCNATQVGIITFTVTGDITNGSGDTSDVSLSKQVEVIAAKSSVNTLSDLKVDGVTVSGFSSSNTSYTIKDNTGSNINITAIATDSKASILGTGNKTLNYGKNTFNVVVKAENGSEKTYTIIVNKPDNRSTNNNLKSLSIDKGSISFNKNTTVYTIKVEHDISSINISASAEDSKSTVSGTGKKTLKDYTNEFNVVVKAENGSTKTYTIKVIRKDAAGNYGKLSTDNSVKSFIITNYDIKFNKDIKKYNILVDENVDNVEIKVIPNDSAASVIISGNTNLKSGLNKAFVQVISESGEKNEYFINIYKIGEEKEETIKEDSTNEVLITPNKKNNTNIWLIVSIIETVLLCGLIIYIFILKKDKKEKIKQVIERELIDD